MVGVKTGFLWCVRWRGVTFKMRRETQFLRWKELGETYPRGRKTPIIEKESHASGMWLPVRTRGNNWEFDVSLPRKISVNPQWSHKTTHKG